MWGVIFMMQHKFTLREHLAMILSINEHSSMKSISLLLMRLIPPLFGPTEIIHKLVSRFDFYDNYDQGLKFGNPCDPNDELFLKKDTMEVFDFDIRLTDHNKLKIYKVVLKPGDSLLIPPWWWHNAFSEDFSCSITKKYWRTDHSYLLKYSELLITFLISRSVICCSKFSISERK